MVAATGPRHTARAASSGVHTTRTGRPPSGAPAAELAGAPYLELDAGHWSIFERPDEVVPVLEQLWADG